ncbi:RimK family alpha-L-glutamate ligase [Candidatus Woesearchaeota archaeon]|nr:RimK family alpha-L-glutamate ligase [Candidatus Woesearchaeota archaeon]
MTLKAAVISLGSKSSKMTIKAMQKYFKVVDELNIRDIEVNLTSKGAGILHKGQPLEQYDCIYAKGSFRYAPLLKAITIAASRNSYMPISAETFTTAHDKILTHLKLQKHNIPMPHTYLSATSDSTKKILEKINYPIIMKFPSGTQGKGVMFAESFAAASSMLDALTALRQSFLIQEYVETDSTDIRAIVIGNQVVAAMRRTANLGEKRANIHAGGAGEFYKIDAYTQKIAVDTAQALGAEICAVDILEGVKGPMVIEANISPGLQGITQATKIDVATKIARYLHKKTKDFVDKRKKLQGAEIMRELRNNGPKKQVITNLDFRGERILLPKIITKEAKLTDKDEVAMTVEEGKIKLEKLNLKS